MSNFELCSVVAATLFGMWLFINQESLITFLAAFFLVILSVWYCETSRVIRIISRSRAVLITGCDTGFGFELAHHLDALGMFVFAGCLHYDGKGAETLKNNCSERLQILKLDVTNENEIKEAQDYVQKHLPEGGLWAIVNNAGILMHGEVELCPINHYQRCHDINVLGMVRTVKAFLPLLLKSTGRIINMSSTQGLIAFPNYSPYTMSKFAVEAFSDSLRRELRRWNVNVILIEPANFIGVTNLVQSMKDLNIYENMKAQMTEDQIEVYGSNYVDKYISNLESVNKSSAKSVFPVIDAITEAIITLKPKTRYLIGSTRGIIDVQKVLTILNIILPTEWMDRLILLFCKPLPLAS